MSTASASDARTFVICGVKSVALGSNASVITRVMPRSAPSFVIVSATPSPNPARVAHEGKLGVSLLLRVVEDALEDDDVVLSRLEHPLGILDDDDVGRDRDHRDLRRLRDRPHGDAWAGAGCADDQVDLVALDQLRRRLGGAVLGRLVVFDDDLDVAAVDSAGCLELLGQHVERVLLRHPEARADPGDVEYGADLDRALRRLRRCRPCPRRGWKYCIRSGPSRAMPR